MFKKFFISLTLGILTAAIINPALSAPLTSRAQWNNDLNKTIKTLLDTWRLENKVHGVELSISLPEESYIHDFYSGNASEHHRAKLNSANLFRINSVTKSFTAALVLSLEAKNLLNINDPLGKYLQPAIQLTPEEYAAWHNITIKQLLNQTSGICDYSESEVYQQINADYHLNKAWTAEELIQFAIDKPAYFAPGHGWHYSNTNYILAGMIIKAVTGKSLEDVMNSELLGDGNANLTNTYYLPYSYNKLPSIYAEDQIPERFVHGYDDKIDVTHANASAFGAAGALVSTSHDMAKWARMLFSEKIIPLAQLKEMQSLVAENGSDAGQPIPTTSEDAPNGYGLGLAQLYTDPDDGIFWWHSGGGFGYHSLFLWSLKTNVVITMVADQQEIELEPNNPVIVKILDLLNR